MNALTFIVMPLAVSFAYVCFSPPQATKMSALDSAQTKTPRVRRRCGFCLNRLCSRRRHPQRGPGFDAPAMLFNSVLESGNTLVGNAKDFKEGDEKRLGFRSFIGGAGPVLGKREGAGFDFVPGKRHGVPVRLQVVFMAQGLHS